MTMGWTDGSSFVPIASSLLSSKNDQNVIGTTKKIDKRTIAAKRRIMAQSKGTDVVSSLESRAHCQVRHVWHLVLQSSSDCPNQSTWFERNCHGEEKLQDHIRVRRKADERQADLQRMQEASRSFKISPVRPCKGWRPCQRWCPDWCQNSLRKKSFQPQRLDRSYLHGHDDRWKWDHQNLRQKMGHRGLLQDLQEFLEAWHWIPWPVIWCIDCPYSFRLSALHVHVSWEARWWRW